MERMLRKDGSIAPGRFKSILNDFDERKGKYTMITINDVKVRENRSLIGVHLTTSIYHIGLIHYFDAFGKDYLDALVKLQESIENNGFEVQLYDVTPE
jgi:hypothetical protein